MHFLNPLGLLALCSIPLLYLLAVVLRRPRVLVVSSLLIWKKLPRPEPAQFLKANKKITLSFILLAVGLGCVSLALARPLLTSEEPPAPKIVVALDTSKSMLTRMPPSGQTRWEKTVEDVNRLIAALPARTEVVFLTDDVASPLLRLKAYERGRVEEFMKMLSPRELLEFAGQRRSGLDGLVNRAIATAQAIGTRDISIFSDHRPTLKDEKMRIKYAMYGGPSDNMGIVRISARPAGGDGADCLVAVQNFSAVKRSVELAVVQPADPMPARGTPRVTLELAPRSRVEHVFEGLRIDAQGTNAVVFQISPLDSLGDDLELDNTGTGQFVANPKLGVRLISSGNFSLERAFLATGAVSLELQQESKPDSDINCDLHVFDRVMPARLPDGAVILIDVPSACPPFRFGAEQEPQGDIVVAQHELMRDVRLENVRFRRARKLEHMPEAPGRFQVLASQGETNLVALYEDDLTNQWLLAFSFDVSWQGEESATDWATLPAFPIFWMNVVEHIRARRDKREKAGAPREGMAPFTFAHGRPAEPIYGKPVDSDTSHVFVACVLGEEESQNDGISIPFDPTVHAHLDPPPFSAEMATELSPGLLLLGILCLLLGWRAEGAR